MIHVINILRGDPDVRQNLLSKNVLLNLFLKHYNTGTGIQFYYFFSTIDLTTTDITIKCEICFNISKKKAEFKR